MYYYTVVFRLICVLFFFALFTVSAPYVALQNAATIVNVEDLDDDQESSSSRTQSNFFEEEIEHKEVAPLPPREIQSLTICYYKPLIAQIYSKDIDRPPSA